MPHHLEPVGPGPPNLPDPDDDLFGPPEGADEFDPRVRPAWWRWVAIAVIVSMVVAGPFAYAIYKLLS